MPETPAGSAVTAAEHLPVPVPVEAPVITADAAPVVAAAPQPAPAAVMHTPAPPVSAPAPQAEPGRAEPYVLQTDTLASLAAAAGLQWVQSDADKISAVRAALAAEPPAVHMPRAPRRHVLVDDGPLVLVETRKDLSQLKLPFDQQQRPV